MDPGSLLRVADAHLEAAAALHRLVEAMQAVDKPTPPPEPPPGEWRNDRPPTRLDESDKGDVWHWYGGIKEITYKSGDGERQTYDRGMKPYWAPGNRPAPKSPPPSVVASQEVEPEPPKGKWIVGPLPTEADANFENDVKVPNVLDPTCPYEWAKYYVVQPGAPWCSPDDNPGPWDPTTLDHNGWVRSRLPTAGDSNLDNCLVKVPSCPRGEWFVFQDYALIVPGQPWAPIDSDPGPYQP
jgi:hypothetical protein